MELITRDCGCGCGKTFRCWPKSPSLYYSEIHREVAEPDYRLRHKKGIVEIRGRLPKRRRKRRRSRDPKRL